MEQEGIDQQYLEYDLEYKIMGRQQQKSLFNQLADSQKMELEKSRSISSVKSSDKMIGDIFQSASSQGETQKKQNDKMMTNSDPTKPIPLYQAHPDQKQQLLKSPLIPVRSEIVTQVNKKPKQFVKASSGPKHNCLFKIKSKNEEPCHVCQIPQKICDKKCNKKCFQASEKRRVLTEITKMQEESSTQSNTNRIVPEHQQMIEQIDEYLNIRNSPNVNNPTVIKPPKACGCKEKRCRIEKCNCFGAGLKCTEKCGCIKGQCENFYCQIKVNGQLNPNDILSSIESGTSSLGFKPPNFQDSNN